MVTHAPTADESSESATVRRWASEFFNVKCIKELWRTMPTTVGLESFLDSAAGRTTQLTAQITGAFERAALLGRMPPLRLLHAGRAAGRTTGRTAWVN